ncbi:MAG: CidA/LrgA family protein [Lachnospiraceae bacterium]|nr:CidA/LrgA family protein [Lachnospiraceae bacterium]
MKYLKQIGIIAVVSFAAEILERFIKLPVPASVYGLIIMFVLLLTGVVKLPDVEEVADFMLAIMPFFFVAPTVSLMTSFDAIKGSVLKLLIACFLSAVTVIVVTGVTAQILVRRKGKKEKK